MTTTVNDLVKAATESTLSGAKMQVVVRGIIQEQGEPAADIIADAMSQYRNEIQKGYIDADGISEEDRSARCKSVNNVINDVSRIVRQSLGKSIRMTSRKGGYVYDAVEPSPRAVTPEEAEIVPLPSEAPDSWVTRYREITGGSRKR
jgi:hypothetical protein